MTPVTACWGKGMLLASFKKTGAPSLSHPAMKEAEMPQTWPCQRGGGQAPCLPSSGVGREGALGTRSTPGQVSSAAFQHLPHRKPWGLRESTSPVRHAPARQVFGCFSADLGIMLHTVLVLIAVRTSEVAAISE